MGKLAFFPARGAGRTLWGEAIRNSIFYPEQTIVSQAPTFLDPATDSVTAWNREGTFSPVPLPVQPARANFYGTAPHMFGPPMAVGVNAWDYLSGHRVEHAQRLYGPVTRPMRSTVLYPSTVYNPLPPFGQVAPKLP